MCRRIHFVASGFVQRRKPPPPSFVLVFDRVSVIRLAHHRQSLWKGTERLTPLTPRAASTLIKPCVRPDQKGVCVNFYCLFLLLFLSLSLSPPPLPPTTPPPEKERGLRGPFSRNSHENTEVECEAWGCIDYVQTTESEHDLTVFAHPSRV